MTKTRLHSNSARLILASGAALMALSGTVSAADAANTPAVEKSCFFVNQISGWNRINDHTLRVSVGPSERYDLTLSGTPINGLNQENVAIKASPSGSVCTGNGLGVSVITGGIGPREYFVEKIVLAPTPAQERAAKAQEKAAKVPGAPT